MQKMPPYHTTLQSLCTQHKNKRRTRQTGSLLPTSEQRNAQLPLPLPCLYHYHTFLVISIKLISNDNNKSQWQPHDGILEKLARPFWAMVENHWSKLKLTILSAVSRVPKLHKGHRSLTFPRAENGSLEIYLPLCLPDTLVVVHVTGSISSW